MFATTTTTTSVQPILYTSQHMIALTKYVVGHSDSLLGAITTVTDAHWELVRQTVLELGEVRSEQEVVVR